MVGTLKFMTWCLQVSIYNKLHLLGVNNATNHCIMWNKRISCDTNIPVQFFDWTVWAADNLSKLSQKHENTVSNAHRVIIHSRHLKADFCQIKSQCQPEDYLVVFHFHVALSSQLFLSFCTDKKRKIIFYGAKS